MKRIIVFILAKAYDALHWGHYQQGRYKLELLKKENPNYSPFMSIPFKSKTL